MNGILNRHLHSRVVRGRNPKNSANPHAANMTQNYPPLTRLLYGTAHSLHTKNTTDCSMTEPLSGCKVNHQSRASCVAVAAPAPTTAPVARLARSRSMPDPPITQTAGCRIWSKILLRDLHTHSNKLSLEPHIDIRWHQQTAQARPLSPSYLALVLREGPVNLLT